MGAKIDAEPTVDAEKDIAAAIGGNGVDRAGLNTFTTLNTELAAKRHPTTGTRFEALGGTDRCTGRRITGKAAFGDKP
jgi:hypothetical protein